MIEHIAQLLGVRVLYDDTEASTYQNIVKQLTAIPYVPFPIAFHTVDILALRSNWEVTEVLLVKKRKTGKWVFVGGFVDPRESVEEAASREFKEEGGLKLDSTRFKYMASMHIHDERFQDCHQVTTSIFKVRLSANEAKKITIDQIGDTEEIEDVKWVPVNNVVGFLAELHLPILKLLIADCQGKHYSPPISLT